MEATISSLIDGAAQIGTGVRFRAIDPSTGKALDPEFISASTQDVELAAEGAAAAAPHFAAIGHRERAKFLRAIADELTADGAAIVERAQMETGLPKPRLEGELARTTGQLRLFAEVAEEGSWVDARVDEALPDRKPLPRSDIRSMLRPLGPVVVFGASNFPLAFSVAGGDTASALAAGNPVIVKAHPAHPGTSDLAARAIGRAVKKCNLPSGVFALLFDHGVEIGTALVQHPAVQAVAFTGSTCCVPAAADPLLRGDGQHESVVHSAGRTARTWCGAGQGPADFVHARVRSVLHQAGSCVRAAEGRRSVSRCAA
jgi:2,5-dioxopentanoate dehydrogenase